ncbi:hypothetical protein [Streptomyces orinoci]|uniref:Uncharacterized protein n=1 Tax=Streptomyces orinoci TaxID=67339 RepID=A0ABV3JZA8_STRON|nr:hypothetical protein [Streptomyces orinoci]
MSTPAEPASSGMLLLPQLTTNPNPLRVSTFARPEYAELTFVYGRSKAPSVNWPVHSRKFVIRIPTGRQATALTGEPALIRYELTVPDGKRQWVVQADTRNPNETVFTCEPDDLRPAAFDGTWGIQLRLWGIETNGSPGPVTIGWEEETSNNGADFVLRTGRGEVSKRDDSFYFDSFHPATVAIARNSTVQLNWKGTEQATYRMYYRDQDGTEKNVAVSGGSWTSPRLVDSTDFRLKATFDGRDYYLTAHVRVNKPDIAVTSIAAPSADGTVGVKNTLQFQDKAGIEIPRYGGRITVYGALTAQAGDNVGEGALTANGPLTANKTITAKGEVTTEADVPLTANGPINANKNIFVAAGPAGTYYGVHTARIWALSGTSDGTVTLKSKLTLEQPLTANGTIDANNDLTVAATKTFKAMWINPTTTNGTITVRGDLSMASGKVLTAGTLNTAGITASGLISANGGLNVPTGKSLNYEGKRVLRTGDSVTLRTRWANNGYLWDDDGNANKDRGNVVRKRDNNPPGNLRSWWTLGWRASNQATGLETDTDLKGCAEAEEQPGTAQE